MTTDLLAELRERSETMRPDYPEQRIVCFSKEEALTLITVAEAAIEISFYFGNEINAAEAAIYLNDDGETEPHIGLHEALKPLMENP